MSEDTIQTWLLAAAPSLRTMREVVKGLIERLEADGTPICRVVFGVGVLHPELLGINYTWQRGDRFVTRNEIPHGMELTGGYLDNPFRLLHEGEILIRRRLTGPGAQLDFPVLEEIRDDGATDYIALGLPRSDGGAFLTAWSTDRPDGFSDAELSRFLALRPALGVVAELQSRSQMTRGLLNLYLGQEAGGRVYAGEIRRGEGKTIRSVLWMCDLRGFTSLSDRIPVNFLIAALNDYFEAVTGPIHAHGGEVLKFIGDAVLGIFRFEDESELAEICERALDAAGLAVANMRILNRRRARENKSALDFGIALHVGDAVYGNVGAHDRLDFTVIGPAVNLCARLGTLAGTLGEQLVCSAAFAAASRAGMRSLGRHAMKNVAEPVEAFVPA